MILDLKQFEAFPAEIKLTGDSAKIKLEADSVAELLDVTMDLAIQDSGEEFFCQGSFNATLKLECARCLKQFEMTLTDKIDFIARGIDPKMDDSQTVGDDEDYVYFSEGELMADLTPIVRQAILLALDLKPVCSESCRGFCPGCGINRNEEDCKCKIESADPRWDGLKQLRE